MRKSARVTLTVVAVVGLGSCGRRRPDPCEAVGNPVDEDAPVAQGAVEVEKEEVELKTLTPWNIYLQGHRLRRAKHGRRTTGCRPGGGVDGRLPSRYLLKGWRGPVATHDENRARGAVAEAVGGAAEQAAVKPHDDQVIPVALGRAQDGGRRGAGGELHREIESRLRGLLLRQTRHGPEELVFLALGRLDLTHRRAVRGKAAFDDNGPKLGIECGRERDRVVECPLAFGVAVDCDENA